MGTGNVKRGKGKKSSAAAKKAKKAKKKNTVSPFYNGHTLLRAEDREMIEMARRKQLRTSGLPVPKYPRPTTESCNEDSSSSGSGDDSDDDESDGSGDGSDEDMDSDEEDDEESSDGADDSGADEDNEDYDEESGEDYDEESDDEEEGGGGSGSSRTAAHETEYEGDCEMEDADYEGYEDDKGFFRPGTSSSSSATMRAGSCQSTNNKKRGHDMVEPGTPGSQKGHASKKNIGGRGARRPASSSSSYSGKNVKGSAANTTTSAGGASSSYTAATTATTATTAAGAGAGATKPVSNRGNKPLVTPHGVGLGIRNNAAGSRDGNNVREIINIPDMASVRSALKKK